MNTPTPTTISIAEAIQLALQLITHNRLAEATNVVRQIVERRADVAAAWHLLGVIALKQNDPQNAITQIEKALSMEPHNPTYRSNLGAALRKAGRKNEAMIQYQHVLTQHPEFADTWNNLGNIHRDNGEIEQAIKCYQTATKINPAFQDALFSLASIYLDLSELNQAQTILSALLRLPTPYPPAHWAMGNWHMANKNFSAAIDCFQQALALHPQYGEAYLHLGNVFLELKQTAKAIDHYQKAIQWLPDSPTACFNLGNAWLEMDELAQAKAAFTTALVKNPAYVTALVNLGTVYKRLREVDSAIDCFKKALKINPRHDGALNNLGSVYLDLKRFDEAKVCLEQAIAVRPDFVDAYFNLGNLYRDTWQTDLAIANYQRTLQLRPGHADATCFVWYLNQMVANWEQFDGQWQAMTDLLAHIETKSAYPPFPLLNGSENPSEQKKCAELWSNHFSEKLLPIQKTLEFTFARLKPEKWRIGYLSADFRDHPVAFLLAEILELHDKERFAIYGYSYGPNHNDGMRTRLSTACHCFRDIRNLSTVEAAQQIYADGIHILVDLTGHTQSSRTEIMTLRPAPVQINWLGYPGTLGTINVDYIIADHYIIPEKEEAGYSEQVVRMPYSYQPNDRKRPLGVAPSRAAYGIPEDGCLFYSFNQYTKINPSLFAVWMAILKAVPESYLWLIAWNTWGPDNLAKQAAHHGIDPKRLIFAPRLEQADHLARIQLADIYLDTYPYNGHTTVSDALWVGVPVVTRSGATFASRVAGSLLTTMGMSECITNNFADYRKLAIALALDRQRRLAIRERMQSLRQTTPLFDSPLFTRHLESVYTTLYQRWLDQSPVSHYAVPIA